jgi:ParB/RepB/Spo0J family partition protein
VGKPQVIAPEADPTATWRQALAPVAGLKPSPTNPRTTFDPAELAELTENVRRYGVLQPLLVRPVPIPGHPAPRFDGPRWDGKLVGLELEVVAGERRRRAALAAGLAEVPVVVRLLTDAEVLAIQLTEIDQSVGITVSERVRAYGRLADAGKNAEEIAATVERPVKFVRGLLRMARLPAWALAAVDRGILPRGTAELVARVPGEEGRKRAAGCVMLGVADPKELAGEWNDTRDGWEEACEGIALGGPPVGVLSSRDAEALIRTHFTRELKTAPFSRKSLDLLPDAGSCDACPKRAGNDPEATAEGTRADTCLDPDCYRRKVEAHDEAELLKGTKNGAQSAPDDFAWGTDHNPPRGWCKLAVVPAATELAAEFAGHKRQTEPLFDLLGLVKTNLDGAGFPVVAAIDEKHKLQLVVRTADARKALVAAGVLKKPDARPAAKKPAAGKTVPLRDDETFDPAPLAVGAGAATTPTAPDEGAVADRAVATAAAVLGEMAADDCGDVDAAAVALRMVARFLIRDHTEFGEERRKHVAAALGFPGETAYGEKVFQAKATELAPADVLGLCVRLTAAVVLDGEGGAEKGFGHDLLDWGQIDWDQQLDQARRELAGGETADEKLAKAEAAEEPPAKTQDVMLAAVDGIPDAVRDLLDARGLLSVNQVRDAAEAATAGIDLPPRNKLVTFLVKDLGAKIGPAGHAAAAIAAAVGEKAADAVPVEPEAAAGTLPDFVLGDNLGATLVTPAQLDKAYMGDKLSTDEKKVKGPQKVGPGVAFLGTRYVCTGTESPASAGPNASPIDHIWNLLRVYPAHSFEGLCPGVPLRLTPGRTEHGFYAGVRVLCDGEEMVIGPGRDARRVVLMRKPAPAKFYGWDVTYRTYKHETLTCHYVGSEKTARRKAMLRTGAAEIVSVAGLTEEQWVRAYGKGRM